MKRGSSGLSLVVGIDKPSGMSSHDVVNRARRVFGEKRVGHTGTLDPMASGVLPICVGPATRLAGFLTSHDKHYRATITFGCATDTDDAQGTVIRRGEPSAQMRDFGFAQRFVDGLRGAHKQLPPAYSAIKVGGKKACDEARRGNIIELKPRDIEVFAADLLEVRGDGAAEPLEWDIRFFVSKGTYIRALARDIGNALGCPAHLGALRRLQAGTVTLRECVSLDTLEEVGARASLDPVKLLGYRFAFADGVLAKRISNGSFLAVDQVSLFEYDRALAAAEACACTSGVVPSNAPLSGHERVSMIANNTLVAIYEFDSDRNALKPCCVFQTGVSRGDYS